MFVLSNQKSKVQVIVNFMTPGMGVPVLGCGHSN